MTTTFATIVAPAVLGAVLLSGASKADAATPGLTPEHKAMAIGMTANVYCNLEAGRITEEKAQRLLQVGLPQQSRDWVLLTDTGNDALLALYPLLTDNCATFRVDKPTVNATIAPFLF